MVDVDVTLVSSPPPTEPEPVFNVDVDTSGVVGGVGGPYVYASFPVDVVVYFHMQPSTIRYGQLKKTLERKVNTIIIYCVCIGGDDANMYSHS